MLFQVDFELKFEANLAGTLNLHIYIIAHTFLFFFSLLTIISSLPQYLLSIQFNSFTLSLVSSSDITPAITSPTNPAVILTSPLRKFFISNMAAETQDQREKHVKTLMIQDVLIAEKDFLQKFQATGNMTKMKNLLLEMRIHQYAHRYADYLKIGPLWCRFDTRPEWPERNVKIPKFWETMAKRLQDEAHLDEGEIRRGCNYGHVKQEATAAILYACADLGISYDLAAWSISEYDDINSKACQSLENLQKDRSYSKLAKVLFFDRKEVHRIFSEASAEIVIHTLEQAIQAEIDTWFHCAEPDDPETWTPTIACLDVARKERERLRQEAKKHQADDDAMQAQLGLAPRRWSEPNQPNIGKRRAPEHEVSAIGMMQMRAIKWELRAELNRVADNLIRLDSAAWRSGLNEFSAYWDSSDDDSSESE